MNEINDIKNKVQKEYDKKLNDEKRVQAEALKKQQEEETAVKEQNKIQVAKTKLDNILPERKHEYLETVTRDNVKYWVFNASLNGYPGQFRPWVNTNTYEVYQLFVDNSFVKFGEKPVDRYKLVTIAELNSNIALGSYKVKGRVEKVSFNGILLSDGNGNYVSVSILNSVAVVGDIVTVKGDYYNECDDKYGYFGTIPITIPELSFAGIASFE